MTSPLSKWQLVHTIQPFINPSRSLPFFRPLYFPRSTKHWIGKYSNPEEERRTMVNHNSNYNKVVENRGKIIYSLRNIALPCLLIVAVLLVSTIAPDSTILSIKRLSRQNTNRDVTAQVDALDKALESASLITNSSTGILHMDQKTVIITVVNKAYAEGELPNMLDLFLESLWIGQDTRSLLPHILIVAVDEIAYQRCVFRGLHCYRLNYNTSGGTGDDGGEAVFMSKGFINMMWGRTRFLLEVLKRGYGFIFTDTDVMWLRNPFSVLTNQTDVDIQFSTDVFNGKSTSESNPINTGFYKVNSNNKTIALFTKWYDLKENSTGHKEQDVLQNLTRSGYLRKLKIKTKFLETRLFSGFCSESRDFNAVVTVHANCCRYISSKLRDLKRVLEDWKRYKQETRRGNVSSSFRWSPHVACGKSWRSSSWRNVSSHAGNVNTTTGVKHV